MVPTYMPGIIDARNNTCYSSHMHVFLQYLFFVITPLLILRLFVLLQLLLLLGIIMIIITIIITIKNDSSTTINLVILMKLCWHES